MASMQKHKLHNLLDHFTSEQRKDIYDYSGGHLNEANLAKLQNRDNHTSWKSSEMPQPGRHQADNRRNFHQEQMTGTLADFTLGTSGALPTGKKSQVPFKRRGTREPVKVSRKSSVGEYSSTDDGVLVEELILDELMLLNSRYVRPKAWVEGDLKNDDTQEMSRVSQSLIKDQNLAKFKHVFVPTHLSGITKKDQYIGFKAFQSKVIKKHESMEQNVLSGVKAAEHIENKLQQGLETLQFQGYGPNFHRLQLYSDTFDDLNDQSTTFSFILRAIKKEYDDYVSFLLDTQSSKHKVLYEQVENMSQRHGANPHILVHEQQQVDSMSTSAMALLEENDRLRKQLQKELERASHPETENVDKHQRPIYGVSSIGNTKPDVAPELSERIGDMHVAILEKLEQIQEIRTSLRRNYVPISVVTHLEHCIKETEIELQKLQSQKEYFERSTGELEGELKKLIHQADTTERDSRRVWKRIDAVKRTGQANANAPDDDDEEQEDKWNWYIS